MSNAKLRCRQSRWPGQNFWRRPANPFFSKKSHTGGSDLPEGAPTPGNTGFGAVIRRLCGYSGGAQHHSIPCRNGRPAAGIGATGRPFSAARGRHRLCTGGAMWRPWLSRARRAAAPGGRGGGIRHACGDAGRQAGHAARMAYRICDGAGVHAQLARYIGGRLAIH